MSAITINGDQRLFVLKNGSGYSCLGFDVVFKRLCQFAKALGRALPNSSDVGTMKQYGDYLEAESAYIDTNPESTFFEPNTAIAVQTCLETYRKSGKRVRLVLGNPETGKDWLEENDVIGTIGRSMGPIKVPLLVPAKGDGGFAILTACVLRVIDATTKKEVYRHPQYQLPQFRIVPSSDSSYTHEVMAFGATHARFKSLDKANNWVAFMQGTRMTSR